MERALITNIQGYSIHDGPGIRTVVFLKGCPLRCRWCANPENLSPSVQVGFLVNLCAECGRCAGACPNGAISAGTGRRIDRGKCTSCGACVKACYYDALVRYGDEYTSAEVFDKVRRDKMFYNTSGGGVTVSGGEPLVYAGFVSELFDMCHDSGINTCVETCGCVPESAIKLVMPSTDIFYYDLKLMDEAEHIKYTGTGNRQILKNAETLAAGGANILFRQPIIPGVNDNEENVRATAEFIRSLRREDIEIQLMPYHRMGSAKYDALDMPYELKSLQIMSAESIERLRELYIALGAKCSISR